MKVINCGIVVYLITDHHIARIEYKTTDGVPTAWIYYDNKLGEGVSAEDGIASQRVIEAAYATSAARTYQKF